MPSLLERLARFNHRLSTRIVALSGVALTLVLAMIVGTLWLSWQLEGAGAAINDAGSLRMRASLIAVALDEARAGRAAEVAAQVALLERTLDGLKHGEPSRPLFLPDSLDILIQFGLVETGWRYSLKPAISSNSATPARESLLYVDLLPSFIAEANTLVRMIEEENARKTAWLRRSQMALAAMACIGTIAIVYLLYLWFVVPVQRLEDGIARIEKRDFAARLPVGSHDEFGHLAEGFNRMAYQLQSHHRELERRVDMKTAQLAAQNRELTALYEMTAFLHESHDVETLCGGFLERVMRRFDAQGGTVRALGPDDGNLHLIASQGMPAELVDAERCMAADDCLCGNAATQGPPVIRYAREPWSPRENPFVDGCRKAGFAGVAAFRIVSQETTLGSFSLHFAHDHMMPASQVQLLETLGRHLGTALQNHRLASAARQFAVAQERHLVAQGLHDSIAQSLNFLKIQVHMLDTAAQENHIDEVREIVPLLRGGLEESYDDVRELLVNFRTKLESGDLKRAVADTVARFERQSEASVDWRFDETGGPPLPPDRQLQVLFILQEALSNIRKHAEASEVHVVIENGREFHMLIEDDGQGFEPAAIAARGEAHVGFHIMRERAARLNARLRIDSAPGAGTRISLSMSECARQAA
ncbi:type IV pili methyl-accepting chemotaxis transducer N-terminal domain-containing protein [Caballeronia telluris]|uniref:Sensor protein n=1 Tax=Caballeronia telluris TaxID=326475 RepID=A0A158F356_9BURK|nr:type IV pili methyl-accepting chemotaxis transducer N-terminal domain-containing protein [Caballeronia telluris]SAL14287.1 nitrate/nitrite sensor protein [Caballeronia telluris]